MTWEWAPQALGALARFLGERGLCHGDLATRRIGDGHSNLTFLVTGATSRVVVRRPG